MVIQYIVVVDFFILFAPLLILHESQNVGHGVILVGRSGGQKKYMYTVVLTLC